MQFRLTRGAGRSLQEQLSAQLLLGILSGELKAGQRLPSLRQLARMLKLHPNSIAIVYSDLTQRGWLSSRPGSGVFVASNPQSNLDQFIASWLNAASVLGLTRDQLIAALQNKQPAAEQIVIDPDPEFAAIIAAEISESSGISIASGGLTEATKECAEGRQVWGNPGTAAQVAGFLAGQSVKPVALRSVDQMLAGVNRPAGPALIGIVSRSKSIRDWAAMLLPALGVATGATLIRDPSVPGWLEGLELCNILAADVISAREIPSSLNAHVFRVVAV